MRSSRIATTPNSIALFIIFLVSLVLLITLTVPVALGFNLPGDLKLVEISLGLRNDVITGVVWLLTFITSSVPALCVCAVLSACEWWEARRVTISYPHLPALGLPEHPQVPKPHALMSLVCNRIPLLMRSAWPLIAFLGALATNIALRIAVGRMRPDVNYISHLLPELQADFQRFSYPSGHAGAALIAYTAVAIIAWRKSVIRWVAVAGAVLIVMGTGFGRVYLGAHWPSDVLAGYLLGVIWLSLVLILVNLVSSRYVE